jgi:hypothetical protein
MNRGVSATLRSIVRRAATDRNAAASTGASNQKTKWPLTAWDLGGHSFQRNVDPQREDADRETERIAEEANQYEYMAPMLKLK